MKILGIDPGIGRTGWAIVEKGRITTALAYDCFETASKLSTPERLCLLFEHVTNLIREYKLEALAIEELFFNTNAKTAFVVGQARGVILLAAAQAKIPIAVYTPLQVKIAISGYGRADKKQVGEMVKILLKLPKVPTPDDTADALAIALTHAFSKKILDLRSKHQG